MALCSCPLGTALGSLDNFSCGETFGQIQKVAFQRIFSTGTTKNKFTTTKAITALTNWSTFLSADDGTRMLVSPYIQAPTAEAGAARTFGGGNETLGGMEEVIGREPTQFSAVLRKMPQSIIKQLKALQCESNLGVFLFDENGNIGALQGSTAGDYFPIPISSLFIGDKTLGGLEAPDSNVISWKFAPNWSDDLAIVAPADFNPLTDLANDNS